MTEGEVSDYTLQNIWFVNFSTPPTEAEVSKNYQWRHNHRFAVAADDASLALQAILGRWPNAKIVFVATSR
jgi:hypothetical protein